MKKIILFFTIFSFSFELISFAGKLPDELPDPLAPISSKKKPINNLEKEHIEHDNHNNTKADNQNKEAEKKDLLNKQIIGKSGKWTAIHANPKLHNVCYAVLYLDERKGNKRHSSEKPYIMVHYFAENKIRLSAYFGYQLLPNRNVNLSIDSIQYKLQPFGEYAIASSLQEDYDIINEMKTSKKIIIRGNGDNYSYSIDFYDISNFLEIFQILQSHCDSTTNNSSFRGIVPMNDDIKKLN